MVVSASPCVTLGRLVNRNRLLRIRARKRHQTASSRYNAPPHTVIWSSGRLEASQGDLPRQRGDLISQRAEGRLHSPFGQDQAELNSFCRRTPRQLGKEARRGARAADGRLKGSSGHQQFIWRTGADVPDHAGKRRTTCEAKFGTLYFCAEDGFRAIAMHNAPPAFADARASVVHPRQDTSLWRAGYRTVLSVPMLKENELIGVISIYRTEVRPFAIGETLSVALLIAQSPCCAICIGPPPLASAARRAAEMAKRATQFRMR
ncbi:MAG: two-component system, NtrC family, sensor kinase [Alphaproteobacteria bacterium]|jgi:hypothetical protein|nr:two-component system, NtrC family, sensor kinase [Alphaproteobacteria bacterium]